MMKTMKLTTYWSTEEANTVCEFLDALKDAVWDEYGDKIVALHRAIHEEVQASAKQCSLPFDDAEPF
jgi:uncharacterized protein YktA (UPF0223 family)